MHERIYTCGYFINKKASTLTPFGRCRSLNLPSTPHWAAGLRLTRGFLLQGCKIMFTRHNRVLSTPVIEAVNKPHAQSLTVCRNDPLLLSPTECNISQTLLVSLSMKNTSCKYWICQCWTWIWYRLIWHMVTLLILCSFFTIVDTHIGHPVNQINLQFRIWHDWDLITAHHYLLHSAWSPSSMLSMLDDNAKCVLTTPPLVCTVSQIFPSHALHKLFAALFMLLSFEVLTKLLKQQ